MSQRNPGFAAQDSSRAEVERLTEQVEAAQHLLCEHQGWLLNELPGLVAAIVEGLEAGRVANTARHSAETALNQAGPVIKAAVLDRTGPLYNRAYIGELMLLAVLNEDVSDGQPPFRIAWEGRALGTHGHGLGRP